MKKFCKSVSIEVEVDAIATQLLSHMQDSAQSEMIVEAIIGRAIAYDQRALGFYLDAIFGHKQESKLFVDDIYTIKNFRVYGYWTPESIEKNDTVYGNVETATVIAVNPYSDDPVCIRYGVPQKDGSMALETRWVRYHNIDQHLYPENTEAR
jgi:hypothetical protein